MIRLLLVMLVIVPATTWYATRMVWAASRRRPDAMRTCERCERAWARLLLRISGVRVELENEHFIDPDRPQVLVANHTSWFDVLSLMAYLPGRAVFVAKKELSRIPIFSAALIAGGHIFIDRHDRTAAVESLGAARRSLEERSPTVIMFPEGTRSITGELQPFKKGAFVLAIQTGSEIVPAAISGSREIMRKGSYLVHPGTVRIRFGEPIPVAGYDLERRNELTHEAREALAALQSSTTR